MAWLVEGAKIMMTHSRFGQTNRQTDRSCDRTVRAMHTHCAIKKHTVNNQLVMSGRQYRGPSVFRPTFSGRPISAPH